MDIICKCGHSYKVHTMAGCFTFEGCECRLSNEQVFLVHITEQQARLDTNRAQVEALIAERDLMKGKLHSIIGNLDNRQVLLEICDSILRDVFNA